MTSTSQLPNSSLQDTKILVNAYLENCRCRGLSKETLRYYSDFLLKLAADYPELPDNPESLETFIYHFQSSDSRRHGAFRAVRAFYNWTETRYQITNPMKAVGAPRVKPTERPALTMDQLKKLLEYPYQSKLTRALLFFLADTGVRIGEAANLTSDDIYEDSVKVHGKTGERIIPVSMPVREMLIDLGPGKVFKYSNRVLSDRVIKAGRLAGVKVCPHDLRRTFATNWRGSDLSLKYIGGWASWRMVEHYSQRKLDKAKDDHAEHSPVAVLSGTQIKPYQPASIQSQESTNTDTVIKLAEELGATKEKLRQIENKPKYDDLQTIMERYEGIGYELKIPFAKYLIHALIHNFCANTYEMLNHYAEYGTLPKCLVGSLVDYAHGNFDPQKPAPDKDVFYQSVINESKELFSIMANLIRPVIADNQAQALIYREIAGEDIDIENVKLIEVE